MAINPRAVAAEYAVRGPIAIRASEIESDLKGTAEAKAKYPFKELVQCNIGNPQQLKQTPLSFPREVLALMSSPALLQNAKVGELFSADAIERAKVFLSGIGDWRATGAYTASKGYAFVRESVARFVEQRDGPALGRVNPEGIYLTNGASNAVTVVLQLLLGGPTDGLLIPIPQYPLYTALITLNNGTPLGYFLDESKGWSVSAAELQRAIDDGRRAGKTPRGLVVINPGNPTGQVLTRESMVEMIKIAHKEGIMLLADEVYQDNIYAPGREFLSFRKVLLELGEPYAKTVPLVSFHSTSKGRIGECGRRGGYMQLTNVPADFDAVILKLCSISLCANVDGQLMVDLMVNPPKGTAKAQHERELADIQKSLTRRADLITTELNKMPGITANSVEGAMYVFPSLHLPKSYIDHCVQRGATPETADAVWCKEVLEATGIVLVPGSGFGQKPGTLHFRGTILPPEDKMEYVVRALRAFQERLFNDFK